MMKEETKAKIFLADERGCNESSWYRRYSTFNHATYLNEFKYPFAGVYALNDDTIAGNHSLHMDVEEDARIVLLPIVGSVAFKLNHSKEKLINVGQLNIFDLHKGDNLTLLNCYEDQLINFIQLWIKKDLARLNDADGLLTFNLDESKNQLIKITRSDKRDAGYPVVAAGKFSGRKDGVYNVRNVQNNLFVFVIQGVFEVDGILLHARDGLGLNGFEKVELEALSNDAIIFIIELSNHQVLYSAQRH